VVVGAVVEAVDVVPASPQKSDPRVPVGSALMFRSIWFS
jgi:hypothetical protein